MNEPGANHDFLPTASWDRLRLRAELLARCRAFFAQRGFLEVETPLLSADTVVDRHLDPLSVTLPRDVREPDLGRTLYLQTSPEFGMKRLLASGGEAIYQITRAFRAGEAGPLHNPEFTIVEWYRRDDSYQTGMQLLSDLGEALLGWGPAEQVTYGEAFRVHVGVDPHAASAEELAELARRWGISVSEEFTAADRDTWLNLLLSHLVEPHLGHAQPTILCDYPASQAALARVAGDPPVAERFELYVRGIELANGYHELLDPAVLRQRNAEANRQRTEDGKPPLPGESRLLEAMQHGLPPAVGVALGFDRVVMLAAGASTLAEVMAFPIQRA
ncbi:MAG: EF-P lysine aminoacylase GenX [Planctomycetota bacterium]|nr:MAG: EF-P lysine aminoacylase GenX [Planctomycetota bacterium]